MAARKVQGRPPRGIASFRADLRSPLDKFGSIAKGLNAVGIRLQNIVLPAHDLEACAQFYRDGLGLEQAHEGPGFYFFRLGTANLALHASDPESPLIPTGRGFYLDLLVDSLEAARERLVRIGVGPIREWEDEKRRYLLVEDPQGNHIELIEMKLQ